MSCLSLLIAAYLRHKLTMGDSVDTKQKDSDTGGKSPCSLSNKEDQALHSDLRCIITLLALVTAINNSGHPTLRL
jgi:hypothetical protein